LRDRLLDRLQFYAMAWCAAVTIGTFALTRAGLWNACGVLGGGLLAAVSLVSIRSGVEGLTPDGRPGSTPPRAGRAVVTIVLRYALLGFLAYVMIARLRLPPLGLVAGVSSIPAAVAIEAARFFWKRS
jgi:hypothetical protein